MGHWAKKCPLNANKDKENHKSNPKTIWRKKFDGEGQASNTNTLNEEAGRRMKLRGIPLISMVK